MTAGDLERERAEAVTAVLRSAGEIETSARITRVAQISGGWSRASYVAAAEGDAGVREYIVRAKPPGGLLDTDLVAEFRIYEALRDTGVPIPRAYGLDPDDATPFAGPFFVMERMAGRAPNVFRARDRQALREDWEGSRQIAVDLLENLTRIHAVPTAELERWLPRWSFHDVVAHWRKIYEDVRLVRDPVLEETFAWLEERAPGDEHEGLVHADYRPGNMLIDDGRVNAILDWELSYCGDVRFDLGYLALARVCGRHLEPVDELMGGVADRDWFLAEYERRTGRPVEPGTITTFSVLAAVMLTVIMLTGVRAYADGRTRDIRMAWNHYSLAGLRAQAVELMEW